MGNKINNFISPPERDDYIMEQLGINSRRQFNINRYGLNEEALNMNLMFTLKEKSKLFLSKISNMSNDEIIKAFNKNEMSISKKKEFLKKYGATENKMKALLENELERVINSSYSDFFSLDPDAPYVICDLLLNSHWPIFDFSTFVSEDLNPSGNFNNSRTKHRLYICMDNSFLPQFCVDIAKEFDKRSIDYYFKTRVLDSFAYDPFVLYLTSEKETIQAIAIIRYLTTKYPEYKENTLYPSAHFFLVDDYIGYGTESNSKISYSRTLLSFKIKDKALDASILELNYPNSKLEYLKEMSSTISKSLDSPLYQTFKKNYQLLFEEAYIKEFGNNIEKFDNFEEKISEFEKSDKEISDFYGGFANNGYSKKINHK